MQVLAVKNYMSKNLITIRESEDLSVADDLMLNYNIRHLPVINAADELVGILSTHDYFALKKAGIKLGALRVSDYMNAPVKVVDKSIKLVDIAKMFIQKKLNSVLVLDQDTAVGILTSEDILKVFVRMMEDEEDARQLSLADLVDEGWVSGTMLI